MAEEITITLSRSTLHWLLRTADAAATQAQASRNPRTVAHRATAEANYQAAQTARGELFAVTAEALGIDGDDL